MTAPNDLIDHSQIVHKTSAKIVCEKYFEPTNTSGFQKVIANAFDDSQEAIEYNANDVIEQKYKKQTSSAGTKIKT